MPMTTSTRSTASSRRFASTDTGPNRWRASIGHAPPRRVARTVGGRADLPGHAVDGGIGAACARPRASPGSPSSPTCSRHQREEGPPTRPALPSSPSLRDRGARKKISAPYENALTGAPASRIFVFSSNKNTGSMGGGDVRRRSTYSGTACSAASMGGMSGRAYEGSGGAGDDNPEGGIAGGDRLHSAGDVGWLLGSG